MKTNRNRKIGKTPIKDGSSVKAEKKLFLDMTKEIHTIVKIFAALDIHVKFAELLEGIYEHFGCDHDNSANHRAPRQLIDFFTGFILALKMAGFDDEQIKKALAKMVETYDGNQAQSPINENNQKEEAL